MRVLDFAAEVAGRALHSDAAFQEYLVARMPCVLGPSAVSEDQQAVLLWTEACVAADLQMM